MKPTTFEIDAGGVRIAGLDYGDPARRALILVHGIRDHAFSFDPIARALASEFRVLVPNLRGHGASERPGSYALAEFVADLAAVVRLTDAEPVLVGHSLGGQIVSHYAALFDEVSATILIEGLGPPRRVAERTPEGRRARMRERVESLLEGRAAREPLPDFEAALARFRARNPRLDADRARLLALHGTEPDPAGGLRWRFDPNAQKVWSSIGFDENEEIWSWIRCPVLAVTASESATYWTRRGLSEPVSPARFAADLERKLARFADVEHVVVEGAGHMTHYDQPDLLVHAIRDFLKRRLR